MWLPGGGHAWLQGGMHGCGGHVWLLGVCVVARGHAWLLRGVHGCWGAMCGCQVGAWLPGGHAWLLGSVCGCGGMRGCSEGCVWLLGGHVWLLGSVHGCGSMHVCQSTRAVRILVKCILVRIIFRLGDVKHFEHFQNRLNTTEELEERVEVLEVTVALLGEDVNRVENDIDSLQIETGVLTIELEGSIKTFSSLKCFRINSFIV